MFKTLRGVHYRHMTLVADIGGTYVRFGVSTPDTLEHIRKYEAAQFESLNAALRQYCSECGIQPKGALRIATAGYEDARLWKFVNKNTWEINPQNLRDEGWDVETILNDFEAATWALLNLQCGDAQTLKGGQGASQTRCLLGPGTGLGLGYLHMGEQPFVQKTHGGHMPVAGLSDEHGKIIKTLREAQGKPVVFENIVSGPGLQNLRTLYNDQDALRIFHEFLGVFAATAVVTGHAYGGLYLTGGVLENLIKEDQFDFEYFERFFCFEAVASVQRDLNATPIIHITDPYPALKGLMHA